MKIKRLLKWGFLTIVLLSFGCFQLAYWTSTNDFEGLTHPQGDTMKAIVYSDYGTAEVLKLADIAKPVPKDNQLLVRVRAASINPYDWHFMRGTPYLMRIGNGLRKPASIRVGVDYAGTVERVGKDTLSSNWETKSWVGRAELSPNISA